MKLKETHASIKEMPVDASGGGFEGRYEDWGGLKVGFEKFSINMEPAPLFKGLPDDSCQSSHWGYVFKGEMVIGYKDHRETIKAGEAYYLAPGHVPLMVAEGTELIEFSPVAEYEKTMTVVMKNMQTMEGK